MSVRIRMKQFGRRHRPYYRICVMDIRKPRDGRVLEELGTYDPMIPETDARAELNSERIKYWLSVGAKPSEAVGVLIKKYGEGGTHVEARQAAIARLAELRRRPEPMTLLPRPAKPVKATDEGKKKRDREAEPAEAVVAETVVEVKTEVVVEETKADAAPEA